ncbi:hypothetical protein [Paenibacillus ginsengarvi]|nr:hypothetical protein [Paenibacillus ginsengarvi]
MDTLHTYPQYSAEVKAVHPFVVIDVIVTAIRGEHSLLGKQR